jgi:hypothetical protein
MNDADKEFSSFSDFYPFYLGEHQHPVSRQLHFIGTLIVILLLVTSIILQKYSLLILMPLAGYGFAWTGHFFFERNRPATFQYPFYSLMGDFVMFWQILTGTINQHTKT